MLVITKMDWLAHASALRAGTVYLPSTFDLRLFDNSDHTAVPAKQKIANNASGDAADI